MKSAKPYWLFSLVFFIGLLLTSCDQDSKNETGSINKEVSSQKQSSQTSASNFDIAKQREAFALTKFNVLDISESEYDKTPAIVVSFSVPIEATVDLNQFITITTDKGAKPEGAWILNESQTRLYFPHTESLTNYQIEVSADIPAITGKTLGKKVEAKLRTARLEDSVKFLSKGRILPTELTSGLAVESVNISEVDINFHRVRKDQVSRVLRNRLEGYLYQLEQISEYTDLVYTGRFELAASKNKRVTTNIAVQQIKALEQPGIYIAVMKPAGVYSYNQSVASFYISDLGMHTRQFDQGIEVHTLSISNGKPIADVELEVLSEKGNLLAKAKTDKRGNHRLANWDNDAVILATKGKQFAVISLNTPALDLSEQLSNTRKSNKQELFLYGPRDLYRPGETIDVNGILRGQDGEVIASVPLQASLIRPDGRVVKDFTWQPKTQGFYEYQLNIAKTEMTGTWRLVAIHPSKAQFEYSFAVEEFLPERMRLALSSSLAKIDSVSNNLTIKGQGDYLYGAPASGNRISAQLTLSPIHHPLETLKDFYFGQVNNRRDKKELNLDDKKLSQLGEVEWDLPNIWSNQNFPSQLVFEASLFESGGRPVTRRLRQIFWPGDSQIGVRKIVADSYLQPYSGAEFEIINADKNASLKPIGQLEVSLIREDNRYYWRANRDDWGYASNKKEKKVYSRVIKTQADRESIEVPVEYGTYRLEIRDEKGTLKNSYQFFAGWSWDESGEGAISGARPDRVRFQFDKENYKAGEVAKITLTAPHLGQAIVRVESQAMLWEKSIDLKQVETQVEIPIGQDWNSHDLYVSAMVVSPAKEVAKVIELPKRAFGIAPLRLDRSERMLSLEIDSLDLVEPLQTVKVKIKNLSSKSDKGYLTLAAVDTGVLSLSNYQTPAPHQWFYGQRAYAGNIRDSFSQLIKNHQGSNGKLKFGGDAELARGGEQAANDVQIVSIFSGLVQFNAAGEAEVNLQLPDFNGELRLMALAFEGNKFGHQQKTMTVRAPLVAEISKPRFMALNDQALVALDLQNMSGEKQELTVEIEADGAISLAKNTWQIPMIDGEKTTDQFTVKAVRLGEGNIRVVLKDKQGEILLSREWTLGVRSAYPAEFNRQRKVIQKGERFTLKSDWVEGLVAETLDARLALSRVPPLNAESHLEYLFEYPYGCLEQTSSRAWPLVKFNANKVGFNIDALNPNAQKVLSEKNKHIDAAILRVSGMQRYDGSFGLWSNQSEEKHWLTAYAIEFLDAAQSSGYGVPSQVLTSGYERLKEYTKSVNPTYSERRYYSRSPEHYALAYRAYAAYLLAKKGQVNLSDLRQIAKRYADKAESGLPLAHLASAFEILGDLNSAKSYWDKAIGFRDYKNEYLGDYGSRVRDLAWIMSLATQSKLKISYLDLIYQVNDALIEKRWFSTQERFAIYRLANQLESLDSEAWRIRISGKGMEEQTIESSKALIKRIKAQSFKNAQSVDLENGESLFIDLQWVGYPEKQPKPVAQGITIRRSYYNLDGSARNLNKVKSGDYVLVRIDAIAEQRMPEALLVDLLPAGFELENPGLEYAYDFSQISIEGYTVSDWVRSAQIKHQEYRDDRYVAAIGLERKRWNTTFYLMRAVTPGVYQIPPTLAEDMYRPQYRALGKTLAPVTVEER